jgi:hypothetical protein
MQLVQMGIFVMVQFESKIRLRSLIDRVATKTFDAGFSGDPKSAMLDLRGEIEAVSWLRHAI